LPGANAATLNLGNVQLADTGKYYVVVRSEFGKISSVGVRLNVIDAGTDLGGNGLPDNWETANFGHTGIDPNADPDADGWTNLQEYWNGTNPNAFDQPFKIAIAQPSGHSVIP
jgi:hypothetical protein